LLLSLAALPSSLYFFNFVAFLPFFYAVRLVLCNKRLVVIFLLQLVTMLVTFYLLVGHWILNTANAGFIVGLLLIIPFLLLLFPYVFLLKRESKIASLYFVSAWLTAEWVQSYFQLGTPFYNLGHSLAANIKIIQWYEFTGASGGSLWILAVNFSLYSLGKSIYYKGKQWQKKSIALSGILFLPLIISILIFHNYEEKGTSAEVLIVHPSTDNADVKYRKNIYELLDIYLKIILPNLSESTEYVVLPETAITNTGWISDYNRNLVFQHWFEKTASYPNLKLVTGAIAYEAIPNVEDIRGYEKIPGIRYSENYKTWYYTYNAALFLGRECPVQIRVKDKLVPYQEYAPYPRFMPRLNPVGIDFQFSTRPKNQEVFIEQKNRKTAALICYELVYGNQFFKKARAGAEAFFVLLNEGWYDDPKVPQQFLQLSLIRAIENRRSIAHCSNLGISAFINQRGEVVERTSSKQSGFLVQKIRMNKTRTLYTILGNYLGVAAIVGLLVSTIQGVKVRNKTMAIC